MFKLFLWLFEACFCFFFSTRVEWCSGLPVQAQLTHCVMHCVMCCLMHGLHIVCMQSNVMSHHQVAQHVCWGLRDCVVMVPYVSCACNVCSQMQWWWHVAEFPSMFAGVEGPCDYDPLCIVYMWHMQSNVAVMPHDWVLSIFAGGWGTMWSWSLCIMWHRNVDAGVGSSALPT